MIELSEGERCKLRMPVEIRLPTSRSPQTLQKRDPHWKVVVVVVLL